MPTEVLPTNSLSTDNVLPNDSEIENIAKSLTPSSTDVVFTSTVSCNVKTYNENDNILLIAYQSYNVIPKQPIKITAGGTTYIKLYITPQGITFTADLGHSYIYDGVNLKIV